MFVLLVGVQRGYAQADIVPAEHPVYRFFHVQQIRGVLPEYRAAVRPTDRSTIVRWLRLLRERGRAVEVRRWVERYLREFEEPEEVRQIYWGYWLPLFGKDTEKFIFYHEDDRWRVAFRLAFDFQLRYARDSLRAWGFARVPEALLSIRYGQRLGIYTSLFQGSQPIGSSTYTLSRDPELRTLYTVANGEKPAGGFDRATASVRYRWRAFYAELAHARLLVGYSPDRSLILTDNADYISHLKVGLRTRVVDYLYVHAGLGSRSVWLQNGQDPDERVLWAPQRFLSLHRLAIYPHRALALAFTEMIVYANRSPELAYLNPVMFYKSAEHALWDRDNSLFALDMQWRPVGGVEGYVTWLVDDLSVQDLGKGSIHNKFAWQAGLQVAPLPLHLFWLEYTRIDPFVYSHRFTWNGIPYNAYVHNNFGLGHPLGPHADQLALGWQGYVGTRLSLRLKADYTRRGENTVLPDGSFLQVGGDILDGSLPPDRNRMPDFLSGRRVEGPGVEGSLQWEPIRGYTLSLYAYLHRWTREPDQTFLRGIFRIAW